MCAQMKGTFISFEKKKNVKLKVLLTSGIRKHTIKTRVRKISPPEIGEARGTFDNTSYVIVMRAKSSEK